MKTLATTFRGGPADGREDWIKPCSTISIGEHTKQGSLFHIYNYACQDLETGRSVFTYVGWRKSRSPRGLRKLALRLGLRQPEQVTA